MWALFGVPYPFQPINQGLVDITMELGFGSIEALSQLQ